MSQTGVTTQQMTDAPQGAMYVWCNSELHYPKSLARTLGRTDLVVLPPSWLRADNVMPRNFPAVCVDHALRPDSQATEAIRYLRERGLLR